MLGLICKACGGKLLVHNEHFAECEYCTTKYYLKYNPLLSAETLFTQNNLLSLSQEALFRGELSCALQYVNQYLLLDSQNIDALIIKCKCLVKLSIEKQSFEGLNEMLDTLSLLNTKSVSVKNRDGELTVIKMEVGDAIAKLLDFVKEQIVDNPSVYFVCDKMDKVAMLIATIAVYSSKTDPITKNSFKDYVVKGTAEFIDTAIWILSAGKHQLQYDQSLAKEVIIAIDDTVVALEALLEEVDSEQADYLRKKIVELLSSEIEHNYQFYSKGRWDVFEKTAIIPNCKIAKIKSAIQYHENNIKQRRN